MRGRILEVEMRELMEIERLEVLILGIWKKIVEKLRKFVKLLKKIEENLR